MSQALEKLKEQLTCSICLDTYTDPKLLQCNHVFCQKCLVKLTVKDYQQQQLTLTCPICRQVTPVPANGVAGLQTAFHINYLKEIDESIKKIEPRPGKPTSGDADMKEASCSEHLEELILYCETCGALACLKCAISGGKHHHHTCELLADAFERYKADIVSSLQPMEKQLSVVSKALAQFDTCRDEITDQQTTIEADINHCVGQLHKILESRRAYLTNELKEIAQCKLKALDLHKDHLETTQAQLSSCVDFMKESLKTGGRREVLRMKPTIVKQVKELTTTFKPENTNFDTEANMAFTPSADIETLCRNYGQISATTDKPDPSKCFATGEGIAGGAVVGEMSTIFVQAVNTKGQPCKKQIESLECELVFEETDSRTSGVVERTGPDQYVISYQPTGKGRLQLHIKVEGQHIRGSPFNISASSPAELSTPYLTVGGLKGPVGIAFSHRGEMVIAEQGGHCISMFGPRGTKIRSFGGHLKKQLCPYGVAVDGEGNILVSDHNNHCICKFTDQGGFIKSVGSIGSEPLQFKFPTDIAFSVANCKVYVVDQNDRVQVLNSDLTFSGTFGRKGYGAGEFNTPYGVACDRSGNVHVADTWNNRVQVFTAEGNFLRVFGHCDKILMWPRGIAISPSGVVYVSEKDHHRVSVFTSEGQFVTSLGGSGSAPGQLDSPHGLAVDRNGLLYVCDVSNDCVQAFLCHK